MKVTARGWQRARSAPAVKPSAAHVRERPCRVGARDCLRECVSERDCLRAPRPDPTAGVRPGRWRAGTREAQRRRTHGGGRGRWATHTLSLKQSVVGGAGPRCGPRPPACWLTGTRVGPRPCAAPRASVPKPCAGPRAGAPRPYPTGVLAYWHACWHETLCRPTCVSGRTVCRLTCVSARTLPPPAVVGSG